ncbi:MAG: DUF72 domain-containing protein [Synechococcales bacterium]|nr:DUF72 domain-containing protein [Synechococcales bacterium]
MTGMFRLGLAIWGYKGWLGDLFPEKTPAKEFLRLYSQRFTIVEGNTTFYAIPELATVQRWAAETTEGFRFCPKLPKGVSHQGALLPSLPAALKFLQLMQAWGDRLGPFFLQLPPSYSPQFFNDLSLFLQGWKAATMSPLAIEVRHLDWFSPRQHDRLTQLLTDLKMARVHLDTRPIYNATDNPQQYSQNKKPNVPLELITTARFAIVRYISHPDLEQNLSYYGEWVDTLADWLQKGINVYFFVHCPLEDHSPRNARQFQHQLEAALGKKGISIAPLPWDQLPPDLSLPSTSQLPLF